MAPQTGLEVTLAQYKVYLERRKEEPGSIYCSGPYISILVLNMEESAMGP